MAKKMTKIEKADCISYKFFEEDEGTEFDVRLITEENVLYTRMTMDEAEKIYEVLKAKLNK